jgi:hypothetical protein
MIFSEKHHQLLESLHNGNFSPESLFQNTGIDEYLVEQLLAEMHDTKFVRNYKKQSECGQVILQTTLLDKGKAALSSPSYFLGKPMNAASQLWTGDRISGDKIMGDQVTGNKIQIGTVQGDAIAGNKIVNSQNLTQAAQDIKALLDQLAIDYPNEDEFIQGGRALSAIKKDPTLKTRLINAAKEAGIAAFEKTVEAITDNPAAGSIVAGIKGFIEADG